MPPTVTPVLAVASNPAVVPSPQSIPTQAATATSAPAATAPTATATPQPPTPTATNPPTPTRTPRGPTPTATAIAGAVAESDGQWVTSRDASTRYYAPKTSSYWKRWVAGNRVWFRSLDELLRAYPGRVAAPD